MLLLVAVVFVRQPIKPNQRDSIPRPRLDSEEPISDERTHKPNNIHVQYNQSLLTAEREKPTRLMYLVQTEGCITLYLQTVLVEEKEACDCDVMVLSFEEKCEDIPPGANIEYLYQSLTWSKGRNLLYSTAKAQQVRYLYYIFLDDDIILDYFEHSKNLTENPWRTLILKVF